MLVTIGLPVYNNRETIEVCLKSVFAQSTSSWELIVLDDGSSDGSGEWLRSVRDPRVRAICDGEHRGLVQRLNQIANEARGMYLARMDADDIMLPGRIEAQVRYLSEHPECDVLGSAAMVFRDGQEDWRVWRRHCMDADLADLLQSAFFIHPTVMGKTEWFRRYPYREEYPRAEDMELWCRTAGVSRFSVMREPLLLYRIGGGKRYLRKYLASARTVGRIQLEYGPGVLGWAGTAGLVLRTAGKAAAMTALCATSAGERFQVMKGETPSAEEISQARGCLEELQRTGIPMKTQQDPMVCSRVERE